MATTKRNRLCRIYPSRSKTDFSKVGGLTNHVKLLREIIILPLLYGDLYHHFNIKAPRGVIFYGPPGTGKTLVAGALANELNKEGNGKVSFYQRKGADILDKWVGESERKLRELFEKATRTRPSIIFFDELDGLAPERSAKNDQVHSSVVATLLALMDGLDNVTGVIVIGATNRIDSIDTALRRPGRFDRELYFPLPSGNARKEILEVHTNTWKHKPSESFLNRLSELTCGCCGSDLQALCAESVLCCLKRKYPLINQTAKVNIEIETIKVEEQDFLTARMNIIPTSQRHGNCKMRRLSPYIRPLLQRQVDKIMRHIQVLLPHFTQLYRKFLVGSERYAGRLVLKGTMQQGLNSHIVPALLQMLEHIQCYVLDVPTQYKKVITTAINNLPSVLVLSRVEDWWNIIDNNCQMSILSMLDNLHAGLPILLIATCSNDLPEMLQEHFYYNSSIVIQVDDPTSEEREQFFAPLFFGNNCISVYKVWQGEKISPVKKEIGDGKNINLDGKNMRSGCKNTCSKIGKHTPKGKRSKKRTPATSQRSKPKNKGVKTGRIYKQAREISKKPIGESLTTLQECCNAAYTHAKHKYGMDKKESLHKHSKINCKYSNISKDMIKSQGKHRKKGYTSTAVTDLVNCNNIMHKSKQNIDECNPKNVKLFYNSHDIKKESSSNCSLALSNCTFLSDSDSYVDSTDHNIVDIYTLWKRVSNVTSNGLPVVQLELLYDTILACIYINKHSFSDVIQGLKTALDNFEHTCPRYIE